MELHKARAQDTHMYTCTLKRKIPTSDYCQTGIWPSMALTPSHCNNRHAPIYRHKATPHYCITRILVLVYAHLIWAGCCAGVNTHCTCSKQEKPIQWHCMYDNGQDLNAPLDNHLAHLHKHACSRQGKGTEVYRVLQGRVGKGFL